MRRASGISQQSVRCFPMGPDRRMLQDLWLGVETLTGEMMKILFGVAPWALAALLGPLSALADEDDVTPTGAKGVQVISVEQARDLLGKAPFFDLRAPINFGKGHIKGAVALPYGQKSGKAENFDSSQDSFDIAKLPKDKSQPIVFYSDGPRGWKSYKAAVLAYRGGYSSVKWMRDGTLGWTTKGFALE